MKFEIFSELKYEVFAPTTFVFNIQAFPTINQFILQENIITDPPLNFQEYSTAETRFIKLLVPEKMNFKISYSSQVDVHYKIIEADKLLNTFSIVDMQPQVIGYLFPSRYCQSDKLEKFSTKKFGHFPNDFDKVFAINEWIYNNIEYAGGFTTSSTSAHDTLTERVGVCRDFAHLGIALCRALSIPARYFTAYAFNLKPPDFHACFEAFIGGEWILFDATKLVPINGLIKIANGRDAADASIASIFGNAFCTSLIVQCNVIDAGFKAYSMHSVDNPKGLSYQLL